MLGCALLGGGCVPVVDATPLPAAPVEPVVAGSATVVVTPACAWQTQCADCVGGTQTCWEVDCTGRVADTRDVVCGACATTVTCTACDSTATSACDVLDCTGAIVSSYLAACDCPRTVQCGACIYGTADCTELDCTGAVVSSSPQAC
jgi:hypothetical protein